MKKNILIILGFFCFLISVFGQEEISKSKELGLVSYLTTVKYISEFKMISLASNEKFKTEIEKARQCKSEYNMIRLSVDRLINQLSADMLYSNRLKVYRELNAQIKLNIFSSSKDLSKYNDLINEIDSKLKTFISINYETKSVPSFGDINESIGQIVGIVTSARDFREKKISNICLLLKDLKLQSLKELIDPEKK